MPMNPWGATSQGIFPSGSTASRTPTEMARPTQTVDPRFLDTSAPPSTFPAHAPGSLVSARALENSPKASSSSSHEIPSNPKGRPLWSRVFSRKPTIQHEQHSFRPPSPFSNNSASTPRNDPRPIPYPGSSTPFGNISAPLPMASSLDGTSQTVFTPPSLEDQYYPRSAHFRRSRSFGAELTGRRSLLPEMLHSGSLNGGMGVPYYYGQAPQQGYVLAQQGYVPPAQQGYVPAQPGYVPPAQQGYVPAQQGHMSAQAGPVPAQQGYVLSRAGWGSIASLNVTPLIFMPLLTSIDSL